MTDKSLQDKAINIKGKDYVLVSDRILYFNKNYTKGSITTEIIKYDKNQVFMKATVTPDVDVPNRFFVWHSQEVNNGSNFINTTSMLENAETAAVGRALWLMWIGVIDSIASVDELNKATNKPKKQLLPQGPINTHPEKRMNKQQAQEYIDSGKPRFNKPEYDAFVESHKKWDIKASIASDALEIIRKKYKVSKKMAKQIEEYYEGNDVDNDFKF